MIHIQYNATRAGLTIMQDVHMEPINLTDQKNGRGIRAFQQDGAI